MGVFICVSKNSTSGNPYYHHRDVKWFAIDVPRDNFDQDIHYSFGAIMTVCRIHRNNAEERIKAMHKSDRKTKAGDNKPVLKISDTTTDRSHPESQRIHNICWIRRTG